MIIGPLVIEIIITFLVVAYLLQKYGNFRQHHLLVTINVFIAWNFAFLIVSILPLDVSSTAYRQCLRENVLVPTLNPHIVPNTTDVIIPNTSLVESVHAIHNSIRPDCIAPWSYVPTSVLQSLWRVIYWTAQFLTWIVLPLMQSYSTAGDFTPLGKLKTALVENAIYYGSYLLIFGTLLIYVLLQPGIYLDGSHLKVICITASNTWGLFLLVLLEGYGLVEIPRSCWNATKRGYMLSYLYFKASKLSAEKCEAEERVDDLLEDILQINDTTSASNPMKANINTILEKIPIEKRSGTRNRRDDARGAADGGISEKGLAKLHRQIIRAVHMYHRTQCQWNMLLEKVFYWEDVVANENNRDRIFQTTFKSMHSAWKNHRLFLQLEWYWNYVFRIWVYRALCVILTCFSCVVVWSELTFFTQSPTLSLFALFIKSAVANHNYVLIEIISMVTIAYLCVCAYYTVFRLRILNLYYLAPHHQTNEYSLIFCGMLLCRLTPPLCLNFLGLIHLDNHVTKNPNIEETAYTKIMGHMDVIPIISDGFNIYFPMLIFFVCLATYFNVFRRVLHCIGFEQFIDEDEMTSDLVEEGRDLIKREKNRRIRMVGQDGSRLQLNRLGTGVSHRSGRHGTGGTSMGTSSPEENSRAELLKDVEPIDYTEEKNSSPMVDHWNQEYLDDGSSSSWTRIGRPNRGIFDDV